VTSCRIKFVTRTASQQKKELRKQRENFRRKAEEEWRLNRYYRRKVKVRSELSSKWQSVEQ